MGTGYHRPPRDGVPVPDHYAGFLCFQRSEHRSQWRGWDNFYGGTAWYRDNSMPGTTSDDAGDHQETYSDTRLQNIFSE